MSGQAHDKSYDSDNDFEKPKDDFLFYYQAFKIEEKKMCSHQKFEDITTKYWQMIKDSNEKTCTNQANLPKEYYVQLMSRVYKALLPLYREEEMKTEIEEEWLIDSRGQDSLSFQLLTKTLFRIAHQWATHIDLDEYIDLLEKIFSFITCKQLTASYQYAYNDVGSIMLKFPNLDKKISDGVAANSSSNNKTGSSSNKNDDWLECRSDESDRSEYDYKYEEDQENMVVKKYKKQKMNDSMGLNGPGAMAQTIKEPFYYTEEFIYSQEQSTIGTTFVFRDLNTIYPFGYFAAAFLEDVKTKVLNDYELRREEHKATKDGHSQFFFKHEDPNLNVENPINVTAHQIYCSMVSFQCTILNQAYNLLRKSLIDGTIMSIRMLNNFPKGNARSKTRTSLGGNDPITELNKFGYNPALERRIHLKKKSDSNSWYNMYYLNNDQASKDQYRADISRIETKDKFCLKENDDIKKDEEFNHVETTYKRLRQIMLFKKYESIYSDRSNADNKEQKRLKKLIEKEEKRKANALKSGNIAQKGLSETYEEKSFIKMMKGPFYQLESKEGLKDDDFVNCAEQDLIDAARTQALRILIIGKPRSGKTAICANLAKRLDLVHINIDNWINALLTKIKAYEPPEDLEEGQEPPKFLTELEEEINTALLQGGGPTDEHQIEILKLMIRSPESVLKGYLLDLSYYPRESSWASTIRSKYLLSEPDEMGQTIEFTHVVELWCDDEDVRLRAETMRINPEDGKVYSKFDRAERKRKFIPEEDRGDDVDEESTLPPLDEATLVQRSQDSEDKIKEELHYYNTVERPAMEELLINFYDNQYIKLDSGGLNPDELADCIQCKIKPDDDLPLRPLALQIEGASDYKSLLTEGVNIEEGELPRKWSLWRQADPVALSQGKVVQGQPENAAHYHGNAFVFATEENMKAFIAEPKKYLSDAPSMPSIFRLLMLGAKGVGKHTQAQLLSEIYGWTIVDYKELVKNKLEELMKFEIHIPNNPQQGGRIGLSEQELADIVEGKSLPAWKFIPWIFDFLGYPLMKKKPPPPEEKQDEDKEDEEPPQLTEAEMKKKLLEEKRKREEEERKRKEEEELQRFKEDRRRRRTEAIEQGKDPLELGIEDSEEEPIIIEDLSIDQLVLKEDEETGKVPFVGGFILIGFPESEEHINKLKAHGLEFDKIIYLADTNEEDPGTEVKKRMKDDEMFDWDQEMEFSQKTLGLAKEHLNEEIVREISCNGKIDDVLIRLRNEIDPFFVKVDNSEDVRTSADLSGEEGEKKLPKGDFGDFCPITYVKDNWIVRGNPEQEITIFGKTYWLSGEKEAEEFKFNPKDFLITQYGSAPLPLNPPPPRIMILGHRGAGTSTQLRMLCEKYKLDEFELKNTFLAKLKEEKDKRKRRRLLDRGFRPPQPADEEGGEAPPDPEIEEDPEDFVRFEHERSVMKLIYDNQKGYVIDGNWRDIPDGTLESPTLEELLFESRRVPEVVVIIKCKEKATFDRCIDRQSIRQAFDKLIEAREEEKAKVRKELRAEYEKTLRPEPPEDGSEIPEEEIKSEEEIQTLLEEWDTQQAEKEKEEDENDPEMPNYEAMEQVERDKLIEQRTNDDTLFESLAAALRDKQVIVIDDIKGDLSAEFVHVKLVERIKDNFIYRKDIIERQLAQPLAQKEVKNFEKSYNYKQSKFGINSPLHLSHPIKNKKHAVLYRERIYFPTDQEQQLKFLKEPSKYAFGVETIPLDVQIKPKIFVLGMPMSGMTTVSEILARELNVVHLRVHDIIDQFIEKDSHVYHTMRKQMKLEGRQIEDEMVVSLILKRVQFKDCQTRGWVIDDFPKTRTQALILAKRGLVPTNIFVMNIPMVEAFKRSLTQNTNFGSFQDIFQRRIINYQQNTPSISSFYQRLYNNVVEIDALRSKWYIQDKMITEISKTLNARQQFAKDYYLRERENRPCKIKDMHVDRCLMKQTLTDFKYYCPVTWKNEKLLVKCSANKEDCVLLRNAFYYFRTQKERDLFLAHPQRFIVNVTLPKEKDMPLRVPHHKAAEVLLGEKHLNGHCAVTLIDEERVRKGDPLLLIQFREGKFVFDNEFKLQRFLVNPFKYAKASLPVKMPPPEDKISLFNLQKMEDSIAFMEQTLGQVVTRGLREVSENRLKHPGMSVKETMLKLFALFLKSENPANTAYMKKKYQTKMRQFIQRCELPEELFDLGSEKQTLKNKGQWVEYKENYYNHKGEVYDTNKAQIESEKQENFIQYMR